MFRKLTNIFSWLLL